MNRRPIIIDCDPGVDDFFAIMLLNSYDGFDIKAITVVPGNSRLEVVGRNALDIAKFLEIKTRIALGSPVAMMHGFDEGGHPPNFVHGENAIGQVVLPHSEQTFDEKQAWDVIYEEAVAAKGELELVPIGPLTNIAIAILKYPELKTLIKSITIMGGTYLHPGNSLPYSEANIFHDPYAADVVFRAGIPLTIAGLKATSMCPISLDDMLAISCYARDEIANVCNQLTKVRGGEPYHDPVAVAYLIDPSIANTAEYFAELELKSPLCYGQTIVDSTNITGKKSNVRVLLDIDRDKYMSLLCDMMKKYK